ncbi:MAG: cytochrome c [Ardenticatenaceae bacterium]|nr:cytochrome c [Ardenticatenaceae bacterium]
MWVQSDSNTGTEADDTASRRTDSPRYGDAYPPPTATPTTPPPAVPTATPPTPTPANASVSKSPGNAVSDSRASAASADLVARGEKIFQETAGGVGCQYCHGKDARGDVGPNIVGKPEEAIRNALGSVLQMSFIQQTTPLSDQDIQAVAAYLKSLEESQQ